MRWRGAAAAAAAEGIARAGRGCADSGWRAKARAVRRGRGGYGGVANAVLWFSFSFFRKKLIYITVFVRPSNASTVVSPGSLFVSHSKNKLLRLIKHKGTLVCVVEIGKFSKLVNQHLVRYLAKKISPNSHI
jgi:hypothetical protein